MNNSKITRRALFTSVMAFVLCFAMLTGTTFAWFTDQETSGNNKIIAGNLDISLLMWNGTAYEDIGENNKPIFGKGSIAQNNNLETLWEPGKTQVAFLAIENSGNLALKYNVFVDVTNNGLIGALEYAIVPMNEALNATTAQQYASLDWTSVKTLAGSENTGDLKEGRTIAAEKGQLDEIINGEDKETDYFALAIHMKEDANNDYMSTASEEKGVVIDITVSATQVTAEKDSFDDQYDKDASPLGKDLYLNDNGTYSATSTEGLASMAQLATEDTSITTVTYVTDAGEVDVPIVREQAALSSAITANEEVIVATSGNYTMPEPDLRGKELTIVGTKDTVIDASDVDTRDQFVTGATVVFEGVTLNFDDGTLIYMGFANTKNLIYRNCHIIGMQMLFGENVTFENCVLDSSANAGEPHSVWTYGAKNITFTNCEFIYGNRAINCYKDQDIDGGKQVVNFNNCTFTTTDVNAEGAVEINSSAFSIGIEVNLDGCTAPAYGEMAYVSPWDGTNGAKTTINIK